MPPFVLCAVAGVCSTTAELLEQAVKLSAAAPVGAQQGKKQAQTQSAQLAATGWASLLQLAVCALVTVAQIVRRVSTGLQADIAQQQEAASSSGSNTSSGSSRSDSPAVAPEDAGGVEGALWWLRNYLLPQTLTAASSLLSAVVLCLEGHEPQQQLALLPLGLPAGMQRQLVQQGNEAITLCLGFTKACASKAHPLNTPRQAQPQKQQRRQHSRGQLGCRSVLTVTRRLLKMATAAAATVQLRCALCYTELLLSCRLHW